MGLGHSVEHAASLQRKTDNRKQTTTNQQRGTSASDSRPVELAAVLQPPPAL
jgi:hypothetical protein